jgi:hypothetical protein
LGVLATYSRKRAIMVIPTYASIGTAPFSQRPPR